MDLINLQDFEELAQQVLPAMVYDYYAAGAHQGITLRQNQSAYDLISLKYRVLVDVSRRDLSTSVLGQQLTMPILIAPTAFQKMSHKDGELATASAAGKAGTIMVLSTLSNSSIEEVKAAATGPLWYQLYVFKDRQITKSLVERAELAGYSALVLTVDLPVSGQREADLRNNFQLPDGLTIKNLLPEDMKRFPPEAAGSGLTAYVASLFDPSVNWKDLEWLRSITKLPILLKGLVRADDAQLAVKHGAAGIIVSNHGGRQLDTAPATIKVLPEIVAAAGDKLEILIDGGIRRGTDIIKALALGARAVLVGRPILWGLATDGQDGVTKVLNLLRNDLDLSMALCGCPSIKDITKDLIG